MTAEQLRADEAVRWLFLAQRDLRAAKLLVGEEPSSALFHCQQAVEKSLKAYLSFHNVPFRKTHDTRELAEQCTALNAALSTILAEASTLTEYAVEFRYADAPRDPDELEAEEALLLTQRVVDQIRISITL